MPHEGSPGHGDNDPDGDNSPSLALPSSRGLDDRAYVRVKDNGFGHCADATDLERCEVPPVGEDSEGRAGNGIRGVKLGPMWGTNRANYFPSP
jgi:hypothetical protein